MIKKSFTTILLAGALFAISSSAADRTSAINDAYKEAFGRTATADEVKHWSSRKDWSDRATLVQLHRDWLRSNDGAAREAVANSYNFVFGRLPTSGEMDFWLPNAKKGITCAEMVARHQKHLAANAPSEVRANTALMGKLKAANLKIDVAGNIVRTTGEILARPGDYVLSHNGGAIVAAGAGNLLGNDGGSMVAAGGGNILPSGAGGLVGNNGNSFRGYTVMSVGGSRMMAGTLLLDKEGKGALGKK